jgi:hypothetical protein
MNTIYNVFTRQQANCPAFKKIGFRELVFFGNQKKPKKHLVSEMSI